MILCSTTPTHKGSSSTTAWKIISKIAASFIGINGTENYQAEISDCRIGRTFCVTLAYCDTWAEKRWPHRQVQSWNLQWFLPELGKSQNQILPSCLNAITRNWGWRNHGSRGHLAGSCADFAKQSTSVNRQQNGCILRKHDLSVQIFDTFDR